MEGLFYLIRPWTLLGVTIHPSMEILDLVEIAIITLKHLMLPPLSQNEVQPGKSHLHY